MLKKKKPPEILSWRLFPYCVSCEAGLAESQACTGSVKERLCLENPLLAVVADEFLHMAGLDGLTLGLV